MVVNIAYLYARRSNGHWSGWFNRVARVIGVGLVDWVDGAVRVVRVVTGQGGQVGLVVCRDVGIK